MIVNNEDYPAILEKVVREAELITYEVTPGNFHAKYFGPNDSVLPKALSNLCSAYGVYETATSFTDITMTAGTTDSNEMTIPTNCRGEASVYDWSADMYLTKPAFITHSLAGLGHKFVFTPAESDAGVYLVRLSYSSAADTNSKKTDFSFFLNVKRSSPLGMVPAGTCPNLL